MGSFQYNIFVTMNIQSLNNAIFVSLEADNDLLVEVFTYMAAMAFQPNPHQCYGVQLLLFILITGVNE